MKKIIILLVLLSLQISAEWYIGDYVDSFGDKTGNHFVGYKVKGKMQNSATSRADAFLTMLIDDNNDIRFDIYNYSFDNPNHYVEKPRVIVKGGEEVVDLNSEMEVFHSNNSIYIEVKKYRVVIEEPIKPILRKPIKSETDYHPLAKTFNQIFYYVVLGPLWSPIINDGVMEWDVNNLKEVKAVEDRKYLDELENYNRALAKYESDLKRYKKYISHRKNQKSNILIELLEEYPKIKVVIEGKFGERHSFTIQTDGLKKKLDKL